MSNSAKRILEEAQREAEHLTSPKVALFIARHAESCELLSFNENLEESELSDLARLLRATLLIARGQVASTTTNFLDSKQIQQLLTVHATVCRQHRPANRICCSLLEQVLSSHLHHVQWDEKHAEQLVHILQPPLLQPLSSEQVVNNLVLHATTPAGHHLSSLWLLTRLVTVDSGTLDNISLLCSVVPSLRHTQCSE